jgi:hypothetical protein
MSRMLTKLFGISKMPKNLHTIKYIFYLYKNMSVPVLRQDELSVNDYFTMFNFYAIGVGKNLDDPDIRTKFMNGLSFSNQKEFIRFGVKKPLTEIVAHLKRLESTSETRYAFGDITQDDNESVSLFYAKVKKYNAILNLSEERLRHNFIRGLNPENQLEAERCYIIDPDISLEELVDRLSRLEALSKLKADGKI